MLCLLDFCTIQTEVCMSARSCYLEERSLRREGRTNNPPALKNYNIREMKCSRRKRKKRKIRDFCENAQKCEIHQFPRNLAEFRVFSGLGPQKWPQIVTFIRGFSIGAKMTGFSQKKRCLRRLAEKIKN